MFCGRWDLKIDEKWRLSIPAALKREIENFVLIYENEEGCVRIEKPPLNQGGVRDLTSAFMVEVETGSSSKRFVIPRSLRGSISFYYGKTVTLVGRGNYLEVWPKPERR